MYQNAVDEEMNEINELSKDILNTISKGNDYQLIDELTKENIGDRILYVAGENNYSNWRIYSIENKKVKIISDGSVKDITFSRV